jgi:hypothetical protein
VSQSLQASANAPADARAPRTVDETGLPFLFLAELLGKVLAQRGQLRLAELAAHTKLNVSVIDPLIAFLRSEKLCEVARIGNSGTDADLCYILTEAGRARAQAALGRNAYAGPAPVTLAAYVAQVKAHSVADMQVTRGAMAATFDGVVVNPVVLDQIGAGMNSGRALFLHGAAGSGKTYLAERLRDLLVGTIAVPHALMVDGEVIPFFDNVQHCVTGAAVTEAPSLDRGSAPDGRWIRGVRRPAALAGGELTLDMLDLRFDPHTRLYQAPPHLKSNNGIFIIDDLGRQRCTPEALMNRADGPQRRLPDAAHGPHVPGAVRRDRRVLVELRAAAFVGWRFPAPPRLQDRSAGSVNRRIPAPVPAGVRVRRRGVRRRVVRLPAGLPPRARCVAAGLLPARLDAPVA